MSDPIEEYLEESERRVPPKRIGPGFFLNILSGIFAAGTVVVVLLFAIVFISPQVGFNPLPPTTIPALFLTWTPSPTPIFSLPETWTPTVSSTDVPTDTPIPSNTPEPTQEEALIPTANLESGTSFSIQEGSPSYAENSIHPDAGCNWFGIAGQVFDIEGTVVSGILVETGGFLGDTEISGLTLTGMAPDYGEGGYEIFLGDSPIASDGDIWIQLLDQANLPLSERIYFITFDSCDSNLIKINFKQNPEE